MPSYPRRFPEPWSAEPQPNHYVVRDANKQALAYVYYENGRAEIGSSEAQNNNERANSALRLGAFRTACSRTWLKPSSGGSFDSGGSHARAGSNRLVSAV